MYRKIVRDLLFMGMLQEREKATEGNFLVLFVHFFLGFGGCLVWIFVGVFCGFFF